MALFPCRFKYIYFWILNIYLHPLLGKLMLSPSVAVEAVTARFYTRVFEFVSVRQPPSPHIYLIIFNCVGQTALGEVLLYLHHLFHSETSSYC